MRAVRDTSGGSLPAQKTFELDASSFPWRRGGYSRYRSILYSNKCLFSSVWSRSFQSMEDGQEVRIFVLVRVLLDRGYVAR